MKELDLVILGAGPAGISAAIEAAKAGIKVTLLDENPEPGGQIYRHMVDSIQATNPNLLGRDHSHGQKLLTEFRTVRNQVECVAEAMIWGLFPNNELAYVSNDASYSLRYRKLIIAVGAYERPVPFPGWTLPGVLTAGGAQRMIKIQRVLPGQRFLLAGTGPLLLSLARLIIDSGGDVVAVVEAGKIENWFRLLQGAWGNWKLIGDGLHYITGIYKSHIPILRSHIIVEARGHGQVEEAVVAPIDTNWRPFADRKRAFMVDTICVGYGFVPSIELTRMAGCNHRYEPLVGGWIPVHNSHMETSVPGVYATGDCASIVGSRMAEDEGRIAGLAVAQSLGYISQTEADKKVVPIRYRMSRLQSLRNELDRISIPRSGLYELAADDTIVCRCEEITLAEIKKAAAGGATDPNEVKRMTRAGMGHCQGRMCGPAMQGIIAQEMGLAFGDVGFLNIRPPIKPVRVGSLNPKTS